MIKKVVSIKPDDISTKIIKYLVTLLRIKYSPLKKDHIEELVVKIIY
jgi:hypothetical protein